MFKKVIIFCIFTLLFICLPQPTQAAFNLIKAPNSSTVYYVDNNNMRHVFPNSITYKSWFGNDFSSVMTMSADYVASLALSKNITLKPGKYLAKVPSLPYVYAVEPGGTLRHITSAQVAEKIYGNNWQDKLVDLPEVFFENYVIDQPISYDYQIPDGVVYKLTGNNNYYYKIRGHVKQFASWSDVLANGYNENDVIKGITTFLLHAKQISGVDDSINNLITANNLASHDCQNKDLKVAFIFVYQDSYIKNELNKVEEIKNEFAEYFNWASHGLSNITIADEIFKVKKQARHMVNDKFSLQQLAYDFYDIHEDEYDFLFVFDNFSPSSKTIAEYNYVSNQIKGINKSLLKAEVQYGSLGKLKGIINTFNINKYYNNGLPTILNNLVHETLHTWSGNFVFMTNNQSDFSLLDDDEAHWSPYLNMSSPLGGYGWQDNGDGTFTQDYPHPQLKLSNLDLYAMGLMPVLGIGDLFYIVPEDDVITTTINAARVNVDAQKLVDLMGEWQCVAYPPSP